jgi:hypothetical protein
MRARMAFAMNAPALRGAAVVPWVPTDLGVKLKGFWNTDDHGTALMTDDGAGVISSWKDRVASLNCTATTTQRPIWAATSFNSTFAGMTFDGTANLMGSAGIGSLPSGATAGEVWVLCSQLVPGATTGAKHIAAYGLGGGAGRIIYRVSSGGVNRVTFFDGTAALTDTVVDFSGVTIVGGSWSGTTLAGRINGAASNPATAVIGSLATGTQRLCLATNAGFANPGNCVLRFLLVTTTLTLAEQQKVEGWMAWNGGGTAKLPGGHPYKLVAP